MSDFNYDFSQQDGLFMVGLPDQSLMILQAISEKTGNDLATCLAKSVVFLARTVLNEAELQQLNEKLKR